MNKRREKRRDAAEECCRAIRNAITAPYNQGDWSGVVDYLQVWIRNSGKDWQSPPKPLRNSQRS